MRGVYCWAFVEWDRDVTYDYDNAPTDHRHGGKLTAEMAAKRIAELEGDISVLRLQLAARVCSECPAGTRLAELESIGHRSVAWWLESGHMSFDGAPEWLFALREALP